MEWLKINDEITGKESNEIGIISPYDYCNVQVCWDHAGSDGPCALKICAVKACLSNY